MKKILNAGHGVRLVPGWAVSNPQEQAKQKVGKTAQ
jgi:hypothetical protein